MSIILSSEDSVINSKEVFVVVVVVIWSVPFRDQFSILAKSVTDAIFLLPQSLLPHIRSQDPSQRFTDFFLFVSCDYSNVIPRCYRYCGKLSLRSSSLPLKADSNGHITTLPSASLRLRQTFDTIASDFTKEEMLIAQKQSFFP